jgi:hypothetical protein
MTETVCNSLANLFAGKRDAGLLDVKFYLTAASEASFEQVIDEVSNLYAAVERGACEPLVFNDSQRA